MPLLFFFPVIQQKFIPCDLRKKNLYASADTTPMQRGLPHPDPNLGLTEYCSSRTEYCN